MALNIRIGHRVTFTALFQYNLRFLVHEKPGTTRRKNRIYTNPIHLPAYKKRCSYTGYFRTADTKKNIWATLMAFDDIKTKLHIQKIINYA